MGPTTKTKRWSCFCFSEIFFISRKICHVSLPQKLEDLNRNKSLCQLSAAPLSIGSSVVFKTYWTTSVIKILCHLMGVGGGGSILASHLASLGSNLCMLEA